MKSVSSENIVDEAPTAQESSAAVSFRALVDSAAMGIMVHRDFCPLYANLAFAKMFGYEGPADILALEDVRMLVPEEERARLSEYQENRLSGKDAPVEYDMVGQAKDGRLLHLRNHSHVMDWDGVPAIVSTLSDISARKQVEQELRSARDDLEQQVFERTEAHLQKSTYLEKTLNSMSDGLAVFNAEGELTLWNDKYFEMFRLPDDFKKVGLPGKEIEAFNRKQGLYGDRNVADYMLEVADRLKSGDTDVDELSYPDGRIIQIRRNPMPDGGRVNIFRDITKRRKIQQELESSRYRFETMARVSPVGIFETDREGNCLYVNQRWSELSGLPREEALGQGYRKALHPDDQEKMTERWRVIQATGKVYRIEYRYLQPNGEIRWILGDISPNIAADGTLLGYVGTVTDITRQKEIESALKRSEERFRDIADATTDWYWETDEDLRFTYVSQRFFDVTKVAPETVLGHSREELVSQEMREEEPEKWDEHFAALEHREPFRGLDYAIVGQDGLTRYIRVNGLPVFDIEGRFTGYRGADLDVTEQKLAEFALQEQNDTIQVTFENMAQGISMIDWDLNLRFCNQRFIELLDFPVELSKPGTPLAAFFRYNAQRGEYGPGDVEEQVRERVELARKFETHKFERIRPSDGRILEIEGRSVPGVGFVSTYTDVTERRQAEIVQENQAGLIRFLNKIARITNSARNQAQTMMECLEASCHFYDCQAGHAYIWPSGGDDRLVSDGIWYVDDEEACWPLMEVTVSTEYQPGQSVAGKVMLSKEVEMGILEGDFLDPREQKLIEQGFRTCYAFPVLVGDRVTAVMELFSRKELHFGEDQVKTLLDVGGQVGRVVERKEAERSLWIAKNKADAANDAKSAFLATMSHEIRTPMNGVMAMAEILEQTDLSDDQRHLCSTIRNSATSLLDIINDILDFSKIEAGKLEIEQVGFSLVETVENVTDLLAARAAEKQVELIAYVDPDVPDHLQGDPTRIRQVLLNLAGNAVKFTEDGHVALKVTADVQSEEQLTLQVCIEDTGIGMTDQQMGNLFQHFQQADSSTARKFGGTGLGLAICRHLVTLMGGEIGVDSKVGEGSTFWFKLPLEILEERRQRIRMDLDDLQVIVASPNKEVADIAASYLKWQQADVHTSNSVSKSIRRLVGGAEDDSPVDLVLLDDELADASQLIEFILSRNSAAERGKGKATALLVMSSLHAENADISGVTQVHKPFHRDVLCRAVGAATGRIQPDLDPGRDGKAKEHFIAPDPQVMREAGLMILIAEDNPTNQVVIQRQMDQLGFAIDVVSGGQEALEQYQTGYYALLLTDCHMPGMDGFALSRAIRDSEETADITKEERLPIVALTADAMQEAERACRAAGMDDYLSKPTNLVELERCIRKWLPEIIDMREAVPQEELQMAKENPTPVTMEHVDEILDLSFLKSAFGSIDEAAISFLDDFIFTSRGLLGDARSAFAAGDVANLRMATHSIKGAASSIGAKRMAKLASFIEEKMKEEDLLGVAEKLDQLEDTIEETDAAIPEHG